MISDNNYYYSQTGVVTENIYSDNRLVGLVRILVYRVAKKVNHYQVSSLNGIKNHH